MSNVIGLIAAVLGLATVLLGLLNQRKIKQASAVAGQTSSKVREISVNVDGRLADLMDAHATLLERHATLLERQGQLVGALHQSGTPVPPETMLQLPITPPAEGG